MLMFMCAAVAGAASLGYIVVKTWYPWLIEDFRYIAKSVPAFSQWAKWQRSGRFLIEIFEEHVAAMPNKTVLLFEDKKFTYKELNDQANRIARAGITIGLKKGDVVAMMMYNSPAFLWTLLGLMKIGVKVSLINTNLHKKPLLHCISMSDPQVILIGEGTDLKLAIEDILPEMPDVEVYYQGPVDQQIPVRFKSFHELANNLSADPVDPKLRAGQEVNDVSIYIYTSGTTGLPKAAKVTQRKMLLCYLLGTLAGVTRDDVVYTPMPLYHSSALLAGFCSVLLKGCTFALARKFSKTNFIRDCKMHGATVMMYIGELCRYLLTNPPSESDRDHSLRVAIGNGLRQDIFLEFKERYGIRHIAELYASTEGAAGFMNVNDTIGACGRSSPLLQRLGPHGLYQYDVYNDDLVRDQNGHCIQVKIGTPGLLLIQLNKVQVFDGYQGRKDLSETKIVRNVVKDGDMYFNSGDLMVLDKNYNIFFNDRIGDTFRWKGENVSTTEVSNMLTETDFVVDACVYGVSIPGQADGKAGMATLLIAESPQGFDKGARETFLQYSKKSLPVYARPLFLRIKKEDGIEMTSTIKQNKVNLRKEGFDVNIVEDELYYFDRNTGNYEELTHGVYQKIQKNEISF